MPHAMREIPEGVVELLSTGVSAFALFTGFIILKYIFELEFICSCSEGPHHFENMYVAVPPLILYLLLYLVKNKIYSGGDSHEKTCTCSCTGCCHEKTCTCSCAVDSAWIRKCCCYSVLERAQKCCCDGDSACAQNFCCVGDSTWAQNGRWIRHKLFKLAFLWCLWLTAVFMDGDWLVCYMANRDDKHRKIPCTSKDDLTTEETVVFNSWKEWSLVIGLILAIVSASLWFVLRTKCCEEGEEGKKDNESTSTQDTNSVPGETGNMPGNSRTPSADGYGHQGYDGNVQFLLQNKTATQNRKE